MTAALFATFDAAAAVRSRRRFDDLVEALAEADRHVRLAQRGEGRAELVVDQQHVTMLLVENEAELLVQQHLQAMPRDAVERARVCELLLAANLGLSDADRVGIAVFEDTAVFQRTLKLHQLDVRSLGRQLREMLACAACVVQDLRDA